MDIEPDEMFELHGITRDGQVIYSIDTLYGNGGSHELLEANPNAENFALSDAEQEVYELLKADFDTQLLLDLTPISIAKLYVQATLDGEWEVRYELYTDRQDMMQIDKEEYLSEMGHSSPEQIREKFFGIQYGIFHERGESGYISYINLYGQEWGFQMVKEEDGSWAVAFMPIQ
ncbi:RNA polymerase subunit sigma [Sutcliffiella sp. BMC8]|uniref:RNA polymerase subunit sigma n=1 Tax=Sutcliffiella sp. BMC8 TaxID=3073243 RepID=UPI0030D1EDE8